jgi:cellulose synthase/poly-beta-1,6-N-acetylglucosamine synthase-like glycosyltransferase
MIQPLISAGRYICLRVILTFCCIILCGMYVLLILLYRIGWNMQPNFQLSEIQPQIRVSVVIPARNESANIQDCLRSILTQNYPPEWIEIFVVDDHSTDNTVELAASLNENVRVLSLSDTLNGRPGPGFKKMALAYGIQKSTGDLIITTDADCIAGADWIKNMAACFQQTNAAMIIAPVGYFAENSLCSLFQRIDFMTMQGITAASQRLGLGGMANGANLAFSRAAFERVGGYEGIDHLASGDDYLLLGKMRQHFPERIRYLKTPDAIVRTWAQPGWVAFLKQRIRWASKTGRYPDARLTAILSLVYIFNLSLLILAVASLWQSTLWKTLLLLLVTKTITELLLLFPVARFFRQRSSLWAFPLLQPLHIVYIVAAGFLGFFGTYEWKGRRLH